jgi:hypothetical protein
MKKRLLSIILLFAFVSIPVWALAASVEGTIQGFHCVLLGKTCPVDKEDPVAATERIFVVLTSSGSHYFVPNLDRAMLARHLTDRVRVSGKLNTKYNSITADKFETDKNGKWKIVWSKEMQEEIEKELESTGD